MGIKHVGGTTFVDDDPIDAKDAEVTLPPGVNAYAYVSFPSLERAEYGIYLTEGAHDATEIESSEVGETGFDPSAIAALSDFGEAIKELERGGRSSFEEFPFVEVSSKKDYNRALAAQGKTASEGDWKGPGVYDFRDKPPSRHAESVEQYEIDGMEYWADDTLELMFQGDEWKDTLKELAARVSEGK